MREHGDRGQSHRHGDEHAGAVPAVVAFRAQLSFTSPLGADELRHRLDAAMADLASDLRSAGCTLVGHIKGVLDAGEHGAAFFSVTALDHEPDWRGGLSGPVAGATLTMNVIVYGVEPERIRSDLRDAVSRMLARESVTP